jgi:beta-lactamase class D
MPLTPQLWMRYSCVWYSQVLTANLGMEKFQNYVDLFNYGNKDLSGGLTQAWLMSSLKVTPREQIFFLEKIIDETLPVQN